MWIFDADEFDTEKRIYTLEIRTAQLFGFIAGVACTALIMWLWL